MDFDSIFDGLHQSDSRVFELCPSRGQSKQNSDGEELPAVSGWMTENLRSLYYTIVFTCTVGIAGPA